MKQVWCGEDAYNPSKIVCVGRNYVAHIHELGNAMPQSMVLFHKPNSAISSTLYSQHLNETLHYEVEVTFLIKDGRLHGVGVGLDLTKRQLQTNLKQQGLPWERAKAFDGSALLSRFVPIEPEAIEHLQVELYINCVRVQCGHVSQMLYPPKLILAEVSDYCELLDGDILMTGTPEGVGEVHPNDVFLARIKCRDKTLLEVEWQAH